MAGKGSKTGSPSKTMASPGVVSTGTKPASTRPARAQPEPDDGSRRLAALGYGILVLLATPVFSLDTHGTDGFKFLQLSPLEVSSIFVTEQAPALKPVMQTLNLPGTLMKQVSFTLRYCKNGRKDKCSIWPLLDLPHLLAEADTERLIPAVHKYFTPHSWNLMVGGSLVVTFTALVGLFRAPIRAGVVGMALIVYAIYVTTAANFLPTLLFEGFLGGYVLFYSQAGLKAQSEADKRRAAAKLAKAKAAREGAAAGGQAAAGFTSSPTGASRTAATQCGKPTPDKKRLYDI